MVVRDTDLEQLFQELGLTRMAQILKETLRVCQHESWPYKRFLRWLLEAEISFRKERALERRIHRAAMPEKWTLETFPFHLQPGVNRTQINQLAELDFVRQGINIAFIGSTGVGKTGLASSLLLKALLNGYTGIRQKVQDLLDDLHRSIADRRTKCVLNRLSRMDVLCADELGYLNLNEDQANLLFTLMDNRYRARKATIITTNMGYDDWGKFLKNAAMTNALISRFRQRCVTITIHGPDLRELPEVE
ncbi:MAG: ATP-binding protein [bacterium]